MIGLQLTFLEMPINLVEIEQSYKIEIVKLNRMNRNWNDEWNFF